MSEMDFNENRDGLFSKAVKAGKRTYFFDVRGMRGDDMYLTITESKRKFSGNENEKPFYEKHKIFLYREDFEKFMEGLEAAFSHIHQNAPPLQPRQPREPRNNYGDHNHGNHHDSSLEYDDLK